MTRLRALADPDLVMIEDRMDGVSVVIKNPGVVQGLSDLPWHRDCGLGGHPFVCPELNIGIQLDAASAETGQLHMLAGSHVGTAHMPRPDELDQLPIVAIDTEPGDVTLHYGHAFHAAPPPTGHGPMRRAMYWMYTPQAAVDLFPVGGGHGWAWRRSSAWPEVSSSGLRRAHAAPRLHTIASWSGPTRSTSRSGSRAPRGWTDRPAPRSCSARCGTSLRCPRSPKAVSP
jgi:hypothetical protein